MIRHVKTRNHLAGRQNLVQGVKRADTSLVEVEEANHILVSEGDAISLLPWKHGE